MYELSFVIKVVGYNPASYSSIERENASVVVDEEMFNEEYGKDIPYFRILINKMDETTSIFDIRNHWNNFYWYYKFKTTSGWMEIRYSKLSINCPTLFCNNSSFVVLVSYISNSLGT